MRGPASRSTRIQLAALGVILALHGVANLTWIGLDRTLRANDMGPHLAGAACVVNLVAHEGLGGILAAARGTDPVRWPSAGYLPWVPPALLLGHGVAAMRGYNLIWIAVLLLCMWIAGRRLHSGWAGVLGAALVSLYPGIYGESRQFEMDLPGAVMVTLCVVLLLSVDRFSRPGRIVLLGLAMGLAVLTRPQSLLLLALPCGVALIHALAFPGGRSRLRILGQALLVPLLALAVSSVWWWGRADLIALDLLDHQQGKGFAAQGASWSFYLLALSLAASPLLLGAAGLSLAGHARAGYRRLTLKQGPGVGAAPGMLLVWLWLLGGYLMLSALEVHMLRYLLPLLPALALLTAVGLLSLPLPLLRRVLTGAALAVAAAAWLWGSFDLRFTPWPNLHPPTAREIPRDEPYLTSGRPAITPLYELLEQAVDALRRRHGGGAGVVIRLVNRDYTDDLRLPWMAVPLLLLELPGMCITERPPDQFLGEPRAEEGIKWGSAPYPVPWTRARHCYTLVFENIPGEGERPAPVPPVPGGELIFEQTMKDRHTRSGRSRLTITRHRRCLPEGVEHPLPTPR